MVKTDILAVVKRNHSLVCLPKSDHGQSIGEKKGRIRLSISPILLNPGDSKKKAKEASRSSRRSLVVGIGVICGALVGHMLDSFADLYPLIDSFIFCCLQCWYCELVALLWSERLQGSV
jgi:hypothetical protein